MSSFAANIAWTKWNADDDADMLLGNNEGELFLWRARGRDDSELNNFGQSAVTLFTRTTLNKTDRPKNEILIDGGKVLPSTDRHSAPAAADWDGDGLFDILVGSFSGKVYLLRNSGKVGEPEFKAREVLLEEGKGVQWLAADEAPRIGTRSQVHAADYNRDGKLDLLVGYHSQSWIVRKGLTRLQRKRVDEIRSELAAINKKTNNYNDELSAKFSGLYEPQFKAERERVQALEKEVAKYLQIEEYRHKIGDQEQVYKYSPYHGLVWVYLRK